MLDGLVVPHRGRRRRRSPVQASSEGEFAVLLRGAGDETVALRVDGLVGQRELVARPLPDELATVGGRLGRRRPVRRRHRAHRRPRRAVLRERRHRHIPRRRPQCPPSTPKTSSTPCASSRTSARARPARRCRRSSAAPSTSPSRASARWSSRTPSRPSATPAPRCAPRSSRSRATSPAARCSIFPPEDAAKLCRMLGVDPDGEDGAVRPRRDRQHPLHLLPHRARRRCSAWRSSPARRRRRGTCSARSSPPSCSARASRRARSCSTPSLIVEGEACGLSFLLLPAGRGICELLERLGL